MPLYAVQEIDADGNLGDTHLRLFQFSDLDNTETVAGRTAIKCGEKRYVQNYKEKFRDGMAVGNSVWPKTSVAAAIDPSQIPEAKRQLAENGCPTEFTREGEPVFTSAAHERKHLRLRGMYNKADYNP